MRNSLKLLCGVLLSTATAGPSFGAYFFEAENYTDYAGIAPTVTAQGSGPYSAETMSGGAYLQVPASGSYITYQIPANTVAPGTYYTAIRSDSGAGHGLFLDHATGLIGTGGAFSVYGLTYNSESGTFGQFGWDLTEDYWNSNAFATVTIVAGQGDTFRINSATGDPISVDMIALLDTQDLPTGIPEPASMGLLAGAALLFTRRRRA